MISFVPALTSLTFLGMDSNKLSSSSLMTLLLHSSMCSDTGTEYCMGGTWLLGLSERSVHEVTTVVVGSSLTGIGVAKGAGMHCALEMSAGEEE